MPDTTSLNETELLLLQRQMEGDVSGLNYTLESTDVRTARFTGNQSGHVPSSPPVQETANYGTIDSIKFHVRYEGDNLEDDRNVMLTIYSDGKINCQTYVLPKLIDKVIEEVNLISKCKDYLTPLNELLEYIDDEYATRPTRDRDSRRDRIYNQFGDLIEHYFDTEQLSETEIELYKSIIANLGIGVCTDGVPATSSIDDVISTPSESLPIDDDSEIKEFFNVYCRRNDLNSDIDYPKLVDHFEYILLEDWSKPLNLIQNIDKSYEN